MHIPGHQPPKDHSSSKKVLDLSNFYVRERSLERRSANGNYVAFACGPILGRQRYINERIELELLDFKLEIEEKFAKSKVNREFRFPRLMPPPAAQAKIRQDALRVVRNEEDDAS